MRHIIIIVLNYLWTTLVVRYEFYIKFHSILYFIHITLLVNNLKHLKTILKLQAYLLILKCYVFFTSFIMVGKCTAVIEITAININVIKYSIHPLFKFNIGSPSIGGSLKKQ